jgi:hypothetical protein
MGQKRETGSRPREVSRPAALGLLLILAALGAHCIPSGARDAVVRPYVRRFAVRIMDRLHLTRVEECRQ